jgi:hypothetical protein
MDPYFSDLCPTGLRFQHSVYVVNDRRPFILMDASVNESDAKVRINRKWQLPHMNQRYAIIRKIFISDIRHDIPNLKKAIGQCLFRFNGNYVHASYHRKREFAGNFKSP